MTRIFILLCAFFAGLLAANAATSTISDSIDIQHIELSLDITDYAGQTIRGSAAVQLVAKVDGIAEVPLDAIMCDLLHSGLGMFLRDRGLSSGPA